jgi:hypothetical protein
VAAQHDPADINGCSLGNAVGGIFQPASGRLDLILLGDCQAGPTNGGTIYYATSNTSGHYTLREITEDVRQWDYNLPYVADVDSNGLPDVVLIGYQVGPHGSFDNQLDFLVNKGSGTFALKTIFDENSYAASYDNQVFSGAAGRFNSDNIDDAVAGFTESPDGCCTPDTPGIAVLDGLGHFQYSRSQNWKVNGYPYATVAANFNGDSRSDIATLTHNKHHRGKHLACLSQWGNDGSLPGAFESGSSPLRSKPERQPEFAGDRSRDRQSGKRNGESSRCLCGRQQGRELRGSHDEQGDRDRIRLSPVVGDRGGFDRWIASVEYHLHHGAVTDRDNEKRRSLALRLFTSPGNS